MQIGAVKSKRVKEKSECEQSWYLKDHVMVKVRWNEGRQDVRFCQTLLQSSCKRVEEESDSKEVGDTFDTAPGFIAVAAVSSTQVSERLLFSCSSISCRTWCWCSKKTASHRAPATLASKQRLLLHITSAVKAKLVRYSNTRPH